MLAATQRVLVVLFLLKRFFSCSGSDSFTLFKSDDNFNGDCSSQFAFGPHDSTLSQILLDQSYLCVETVFDLSSFNSQTATAQASNSGAQNEEYTEKESSFVTFLSYINFVYLIC